MNTLLLLCIFEIKRKEKNKKKNKCFSKEQTVKNIYLHTHVRKIELFVTKTYTHRLFGSKIHRFIYLFEKQKKAF